MRGNAENIFAKTYTFTILAFVALLTSDSRTVRFCDFDGNAFSIQTCVGGNTEDVFTSIDALSILTFVTFFASDG